MWQRFFKGIGKYLIGASLCAFASAALPAPSQIDWKPHWKAGDAVSYLLAKTQSRRGNTTVSRTPIQIQVLEATNDGFLVRVRFGETLYDAPQPPNDPLSAAHLSTGVDIQLAVDRNGAIQRVHNWDDVRASLLMKSHSLIGDRQPGSAAEPPADKAVERVNLMLSSEEQFRSAALPDLQLLFPAFGSTYPMLQPVEFEAVLPIAPEVGLMRTKGTLQLTAMDEEKGTATFSRRQAVDPKELGRAASKALQKDKGTSETATTEIELRDAGEFVVDARTGWIRSLTNTRIVNLLMLKLVLRKDTITLQAQ